jgi:hypothetical protein
MVRDIHADMLETSDSLPIRICYSIIYPSATPPDLFRNLPFMLTTADRHEIDSWSNVLKTAPDHRYVNKLLIGTPTKIDAVEAEAGVPLLQFSG